MQPGSLYDSDFNPLGPNDKKVPGKDYFVQLYEGEYVNLKKHGKGKITIPTGVTYEGEFKEDKAHGQGVLTFANGMYFFKGYFVNGVVDRTRPYQTSKGVNTGEDGEGVIIAQMIGLQDSFVEGISKENSSVNTTKQSATGSNVPPSQFTPKTPLKGPTMKFTGFSLPKPIWPQFSPLQTLHANPSRPLPSLRLQPPLHPQTILSLPPLQQPLLSLDFTQGMLFGRIARVGMRIIR